MQGCGTEFPLAYLYTFLPTHTSFGTWMAAPFLTSSIAFRSNSFDTAGVFSALSANSFQVLT